MELKIGFAVDRGYVQVLTGWPSNTTNAKTWLNSHLQMQMNILNFMYLDQVNVFLRMAQVEMRFAATTEAWNQIPLSTSITGTTRNTTGCAVSFLLMRPLL